MLKFLKLLPSKPTPSPLHHHHLHHHHFSTSPVVKPPVYEPKPGEPNVAIFWDVDSTFRKSYYPYDASVRLRRACERFGFVKYKFAYADCHAWRIEPVEVRKKRVYNTPKHHDKWGKENVKKTEPSICRICGRMFYDLERLEKHFSGAHEREYFKWGEKIEKAKGKKRAYLVGMYERKMQQFRYAARELWNLKNGYSLAGELERGGFWVKEVSEKCKAADHSLRNHVLALMDRKRVGVLVICSADPCYVEVLKEARARGLKTVVVGDVDGGALKRNADAAFSWDYVKWGKAKVQAMSAVGRWNDCEVLENLEWTYDPKTDGKKSYPEIDSDVESVEYVSDEDGDEDDAFLPKGNAGAWWELNSDATKTPLITQGQ